jgi:hypothetical protein
MIRLTAARSEAPNDPTEAERQPDGSSPQPSRLCIERLRDERDALGEDFEKKEHQLFGEDGFEKMVDRVASIERALGIYDLAQFTPHL